MQQLPIIQSLWIGDRLSTMEKLCISSFLYHGHTFHLYTYDHVENVPEGTVIKDANEILPSDIIFKCKHGSYAAFADIFRYKLLYEKGNYWVDTDIICLRPLTDDAEYIFASERLEYPSAKNKIHITNCLIKAPRTSRIMEYCYKEAMHKEPDKIEWGEINPKLIQQAIKKFNMSSCIASPEEFCPIDWWNWNQFIDGSVDKSILSGVQSVHLWNEMWRRNNVDKNGQFDKNSIYEWFKRTYLQVSELQDPYIKTNNELGAITQKKNLKSSLVSVIVPAFNEEKYISRCLDSIIDQTYQNIEIIIVNDASTDNTRNVVEKYIQMDRRITCIDKEKNAGALQARMTGIEKAKGEYIYSVDSDDFVMPDLVKDTLAEAFKHNADIVQFPMKLASEDSKYTYNWTMKKYQEYDKNNFFVHNGNLSTMMFKKELGDVLKKYIGSLSVNYHDDYIISIILSAFYKKVRYIDTAYYVYCDTDTSMTRQYSDDAILKYIRDTLIFTRFMTDLVPIIFPKENSDYLLTVISNRMGLMKSQLEHYFKECKEVSIYDLYKATNVNKTFIVYNMIYNIMQIKHQQLKQKDTQLKQKDTQLKQKDTQLKQKDTQLKQKDTQLKQQNQELDQKEQQLKQQQSKANTLLDNRWYRFGQMSNKRKIWTIGKVVSKKIKLYWLLQPIAKLINKY